MPPLDNADVSLPCAVGWDFADDSESDHEGMDSDDKDNVDCESDVSGVRPGPVTCLRVLGQ